MIRFRNMEDEQRYCLLRSELYLLVAKLGRTDPKASSRLLRNLGKLEALAFHEGVKQGAAAFYIDRVLEPDRETLPAHIVHRLVYEESDTPLINHEQELLSEHPEAKGAAVLDPSPAGAFRPLTLSEAVEQGHLSPEADVMRGRRTAELPLPRMSVQRPQVAKLTDYVPPEVADELRTYADTEPPESARSADPTVELPTESSELYQTSMGSSEALLADKRQLAELVSPELAAELMDERPELDAVEEAVAIATKRERAFNSRLRSRPPTPDETRETAMRMMAAHEIERAAKEMVRDTIGPIIERVVRDEMRRGRGRHEDDGDLDPPDFNAPLSEELEAEEDRPREAPQTIERMREVLQQMLQSGYKPESYSGLVLALHRTLMMDAAFVDLQLSSAVGRTMLEQCGLFELRVSELDPNVVKFYESLEDVPR